MVEHSFTPGPWDYERNLEDGDLPRPWIGRLSENRFTALSCGETRAEAEANARLIASAPTLLKACADWIAYIDAPAEQGDGKREDFLFAQMRAAISQAIGEGRDV